MKHSLLMILFFIPCITFQTYTMELEKLNNHKELTLSQAVSKDEQEKSALLKEIITANNPNLIKSVITHTKQIDKLQLNNDNTKSEAVYINVDLLEKEQKLVQERDYTKKTAIKNHSINCNGGAYCDSPACSFMVFPGSCFCVLACFIVILPILAITGVLSHAS